MSRFTNTRLVAIMGIFFMLMAIVGCGGGGGGGTTTTTPTTPTTTTQTSATVNGSINPVSAAPGEANFQAAGEEFDVVLVDAATNEPVPASDLDPSTPNNITKTSNQPYSFILINNFAKAYKVIAKGRSVTNKNQILTSFIGTLASSEKSPSFSGRNVDPTTTAFALTNEFVKTKDAATLQNAYIAKKNNVELKKYANAIINRKDLLAGQTIDFSAAALQKLENSFKAILDAKTTEVEALKKGFEVQFQTGVKTIAQKLQEAKSLLATDSVRKNETFVKNCVDMLNGVDGILKNTELLNSNTAENKLIVRDAKLLYACATNYLGKIQQNKGTTATAASLRAPSLMAAYDAMNNMAAGESTTTYTDGYNMVKDMVLTDADRAEGKDKELAGVLLKCASALSKTNPAMVDEAKRKANSIIAKMEAEGTGEILLPSGEALDKDELLAEEGEAYINAGRPSEAVDVFQHIKETGTDEEKANKKRIKKFGLGRAFLQLNDIKNAYENLRDTVQDVIKTSQGVVSEDDSVTKRSAIEEQFEEVNEALFAFAAVMDKLLNDTTLSTIKEQIKTEEGTGQNMILGDNTVTVVKIVTIIKPTTSFYQVANNVTTGQFGNQYANIVTQTDENKKKFEDGLKMFTKAREMIENYRAISAIAEKQKAVFGDGGTVENPLAGSIIKLIRDARANFFAVYNAIDENLPATTLAQKLLKADAYYQYALTFIAEFRALEIVFMVQNDLRDNAKKLLYEIRSYLDLEHYSHLSFTVGEMIRSLTEEERSVTGSNAVVGNTDFDSAQNNLTNAENLYFDGEKPVAFAQFQKALDLFIKIYKDATTPQKLKELSLYFSGYCLFNQYNCKDRADAVSYTPAGTTAVVLVKELKVKAIERLKLFLLKYPNSDFNQNAKDMVNDLNSIISVSSATDIGGSTTQTLQEYPGVEFKKALGVLENIRFMYTSNAATSEIDAKFNYLESVFKAVGIENTTEVKYLGTFQLGSENTMHFRNYAYFLLGTLNMDRYLLALSKKSVYKNKALEVFNHLVLEHADESFIVSAKEYIAQLQNNGVVAKFDSAMPVISELIANPALIDRMKDTGDVQLNLSVNVSIPDASSDNEFITGVTGEVKQLGRAVTGFDKISFTNSPQGSATWVATKIISKNAKLGKYDFELTAKSSTGKLATITATFVIKGEANVPQIVNVNFENINENHVFNVKTNMAPIADKFTDIFVDIMALPEAGSYNTDPTPVYGFQNIKLERDSNDTMRFLLDQAKKFAKLEAGKNYMFVFKMIKLNPYNPNESLFNPVHSVAFNFTLVKEVAAADRETVLAKYIAILDNFNKTSLSGTVRATNFSNMHVEAMNTEEIKVLAAGLDNLRGAKIVIPAGATTNIEYKDVSTVIVRAPWEISGYYVNDLPNGIYFSDGEEFLPPGRAGFYLKKNVNGDQLFNKKIVNGVVTWKIGNMGYESVTTPSASVYNDVNVKPVITSIGQKDVIEPVTSPINISEYKESPAVEVRGKNFNTSDPEAKRYLQIVGPSAFPIILLDCGSTAWTNTGIFFPGVMLNGLSGEWQMQLFDTKYGTLFSFPIYLGEEMAAGTNPFKTRIFSVKNGEMEHPVYNLNQPIAIDKTQDLSILGEGFVPGSYSLKYYSNSAFTELFAPASADWENYWVTGEIKITGNKLSQKLQNISMPFNSMLVIKEGTNSVSITIPVTFYDKAPTASTENVPAIINTVNGIPADTLVTLKKAPNASVLDINLRGMNFKSYTKRHLDLVFQYNGMPVHVPIAYSTDNGWQNESIDAVIRLTDTVPVIFPGQPTASIQSYMDEYSTGLLIWDDAQGSQVNPFMVMVTLMLPYDSVTTVAPYINTVNGKDFTGVPVVVTFASATDEVRTVSFGGYNFGPRVQTPPRGIYIKDMPSPSNPDPVPQKFDVLAWEFDSVTRRGTISVNIVNTSMNIGMKLFSIADETAAGPVLVSNEIPMEIKVQGNQPVYTIPTTELAYIDTVNGASALQTVAVPQETTIAVFVGRNLKSNNNNYRALFARMIPTEMVPYPEAHMLMDSYSPDWTDTAITFRNANPEPGVFEIYMTEPQFNNRIVSNVVMFSYVVSQNAPKINRINGNPVPETGMAPVVIDPLTTPVIVLNGQNFGEYPKPVVFKPFPSPTNYNPQMITLQVISWTPTEIRVSRPEMTNIGGGELALGAISGSDIRYATTPIPIVFQSTSPTAFSSTPKYVAVPAPDATRARKVLLEFSDNAATVNSGLAITSQVDLRSTPNRYMFIIDQIVLSKGSGTNADSMKDDFASRVELFHSTSDRYPIVYNGGGVLPVDPKLLNPIPNGQYNYLILSIRNLNAEGMFAGDPVTYSMPMGPEPNVFGLGQTVAAGAAQIHEISGTYKMDGAINLTTAENKIKLVFTPKDTFARVVSDPANKWGTLYDLRVKPYTEYVRVVDLIEIPTIGNMYYDGNTKNLIWDKVYVEGRELPYRLEIDGVVYGDQPNLITANSFTAANFANLGVAPGQHYVRVQAWIPGTVDNAPKYGQFNTGIPFYIEKPVEYVQLPPAPTANLKRVGLEIGGNVSHLNNDLTVGGRILGRGTPNNMFIKIEQVVLSKKAQTPGTNALLLDNFASRVELFRSDSYTSPITYYYPSVPYKVYGGLKQVPADNYDYMILVISEINASADINGDYFGTRPMASQLIVGIGLDSGVVGEVGSVGTSKLLAGINLTGDFNNLNLNFALDKVVAKVANLTASATNPFFVRVNDIRIMPEATVVQEEQVLLPAIDPQSLFFDQNTRMLSWSPSYFNGQPLAYMLVLDGKDTQPIRIMDNFFYLPGDLPAGAHNVNVSTMLPGTEPPVTGPASPLQFYSQGTTIPGTTTGAPLPQVQGLRYDPTSKMLNWNAVTSETALYVTYNIEADGTVMSETLGMNQYYVGNFYGTHEVRVRATNPDPTAMYQYGPFSEYVNFVIEAGTGGVGISAPAGLYYNAVNKAVAWNPVFFNGQPCSYHVYVDGYFQNDTPSPYYNVMAFMGTHEIQVAAFVPGAVPMIDGPMSTSLGFLNAEGTQQPQVLPQVPNFSVLNNVATWDRFAGVLPVSNPYLFYYVVVDGIRLVDTTSVVVKIADTQAPNYNINLANYGLTAGNHTVEIQAFAAASIAGTAMDVATIVAQSQAVNAFITGGQSPSQQGMPTPECFVFDGNNNIVKWTPIFTSDGTNARYVVKLDNYATVEVASANFGMPDDITLGYHSILVQAFHPTNPALISSVAPVFNFNVYNTQNLWKGVPQAAGLQFDAMTATLSWGAVTDAVKYRVITYNKVNGLFNEVVAEVTGTSCVLSAQTMFMGLPAGDYAFAVKGVKGLTGTQLGIVSVPVVIRIIGDGTSRTYNLASNAGQATVTAPTGVNYVPLTGDLTWNPVPGASYYIIYLDNTYLASTMDGYNTFQNLLGMLPADGQPHVLSVATYAYGRESVKSYGVSTTQQQLPLIVVDNNTAPQVMGWNSYTGTRPVGKTYLFYKLNVDGAPLMDMGNVYIQDGSGTGTYSVNLQTMGVASGSHSVEVLAYCTTDAMPTSLPMAELVAKSDVFNRYIASASSAAVEVVGSVSGTAFLAPSLAASSPSRAAFSSGDILEIVDETGIVLGSTTLATDPNFSLNIGNLTTSKKLFARIKELNTQKYLLSAFIGTVAPPQGINTVINGVKINTFSTAIASLVRQIMAKGTKTQAEMAILNSQITGSLSKIDPQVVLSATAAGADSVSVMINTMLMDANNNNLWNAVVNSQKAVMLLTAAIGKAKLLGNVAAFKTQIETALPGDMDIARNIVTSIQAAAIANDFVASNADLKTAITALNLSPIAFGSAYVFNPANISTVTTLDRTAIQTVLTALFQ